MKALAVAAKSRSRQCDAWHRDSFLWQPCSQCSAAAASQGTSQPRPPVQPALTFVRSSTCRPQGSGTVKTPSCLGGQAARIELDDDELADGMSTWYRLAYVSRGTRLQVFEHSAIATVGPESDMMRFETIAWRLANQVVEPENRSTASEELPHWAHVRTGDTDGPSAGLMMALAYIDLLTPGALVGEMRVAGTGGIRPDGLAFPVHGIDVKVATAMLDSTRRDLRDQAADIGRERHHGPVSRGAHPSRRLHRRRMAQRRWVRASRPRRGRPSRNSSRRRRS